MTRDKTLFAEEQQVFYKTTKMEFVSSQSIILILKLRYAQMTVGKKKKNSLNLDRESSMRFLLKTPIHKKYLLIILKILCRTV